MQVGIEATLARCLSNNDPAAPQPSRWLSHTRSFARPFCCLPSKRLRRKRVSQRLDALHSSLRRLFPRGQYLSARVAVCSTHTRNTRTWLAALASKTQPTKYASGLRPSSTHATALAGRATSDCAAMRISASRSTTVLLQRTTQVRLRRARDYQNCNARTCALTPAARTRR